VLQNRITSIRIRLLFYFDADPPSTISFDADPDQFFYNVDPDQSDANHQCWPTEPPRLQCESPRLQVILHSSRPYNADPASLSLVRIWIRIFTRMRMRIRLPKMMQIPADLYSQHWLGLDSTYHGPNIYKDTKPIIVGFS
jgi:hypothetical protein